MSSQVDGGALAMVPVVPIRDAPLIHSWASQERARFWGMGDYRVEDVLEVYEFLDGLTTHQAYFAQLDGVPVALFQTYEPAADPVGEYYEVQPGDFGLHFMIAPAEVPVSGFTAALFEFLVAYAFEDPEHQRLVIEPDARNDKAIGLATRCGFTAGERIELPHKPARLAFLSRKSWSTSANRPG